MTSALQQRVYQQYISECSIDTLLKYNPALLQAVGILITGLSDKPSVLSQWDCHRITSDKGN